MQFFYNINKYTKITLLSLFLFNITACSGGSEPDQSLKIELTSERVARGKHLVVNVCDCMGCHSTVNAGYFGRPVIKGTEGKGGTLFGHDNGFPGELYSKNITPYSLKNWSDGEIVRALTEGRSKDGHALFPLMPYNTYGKMAKEDIYSIVAYIRTLKPIQNDIPERKLDFPLNILVNFMPTQAQFSEIPDKKDSLKYGKYLVNAGGCIICHSQMNKGKIIEGKEFAGGEKFIIENGVTIYSANITPDKSTGIGKWTKDMFISRIKSYDNDKASMIPVNKGSFNTIMPWLALSKLSKEELGAMYDYLQTLKPVENKVTVMDTKKEGV